MKTFHVYLHPARGYEAVQEGPCLPALCLSVFWLVFRGLIVPAAMVLLGAALVVGAEMTAGRNAVDEIQSWSFRLLTIAAALALWLLPVIYGNRWRHADLLRRGFAQVACLPALSGDDAVARALSLDAAAGSGEATQAGLPAAAAADHAAGRQTRRERRQSAADPAAGGRSLRPGAEPAGETVLAAR